jgi:hypothetical protein
MGDRQQQRRGRAVKSRRAQERQPLQYQESQPQQLDASFELARALVVNEVLPGVEDFREYMATQNRRLEVTAYLDHIEGPQVVVHISRPDGRITATLIAEVTPDGILPYWDARATGRFKTHWTEHVPGGASGLTRDHILEKLKELYATDFS